MITLYDGANCPCDYPCPRHGDCQACQDYHHTSGSQTCCERLAAQERAHQPDNDIN